MQSDPRLLENFLNSPRPYAYAHTHVHASTSQHWELLEETRCYLTKTCWRQCVWVRRAADIVDMLQPYVHPGCSTSAGPTSTDSLQMFLQGKVEYTIVEQMATGDLCQFWDSHTQLISHWLSYACMSLWDESMFYLFIVSPTCSRSSACEPVCVPTTWQVCAGVPPYHSTLHKLVPAPPNSHTHTQISLPIQRLSCLSWWTHLVLWVNTIPVEAIINSAHNNKVHRSFFKRCFYLHVAKMNLKISIWTTGSN